jgi:sugar lactone lactonase YvrE
VSARLSTGAVYFADKVKGTVEFSADYGATHQTFASDLEEPVGVEVDDDNARLYVGDYEAGAIWAYDLDKPGFRVPFQANCTQPRSILLNDGYVYWIEVGGSDPDSVAAGAVYRQPAGQFGGAKTLFASGFVDPDALAVIEDTLLITDESSGFITHAAFDADGVVEAADYQLVKAAAPRAIASFTSVDVDASGAWAQLAAVAAGASAASLPVGGLLGVLAVGLVAAKAASKKQAAYEPLADAEV